MSVVEFEPIKRDENKKEMVKPVSQQLIPSVSDNSQKIMDTMYGLSKELQEFKELLTTTYQCIFTDPSKLYNEIVNDSRGTLVKNNILDENVKKYFETKLIENLHAIYENSPAFFVDSFVVNKKGKNVVNNIAFRKYEKYIYLLSFIVYVNKNKDKILGYLNHDQEPIIKWAQYRMDVDLEWVLNGPVSNSAIDPNFVKEYELLISLNSEFGDAKSLISKLSLLFNEISALRVDSHSRPNTFEKVLNNAGQYFIIVRDDPGLQTHHDDYGNLIFDAKYINLGDVKNNKIVANYNHIVVDMKKDTIPPSAINFKSLEQLFTVMNSISVQELSFAYNIFTSDLSKFHVLYLCFPGIQTIEHTIIGDIERGPLIIAGKFINNKERRRFEFIPNETMVTFDGTQTSVSNFTFYITNNPNKSNQSPIISNALTTGFYKNDVYNHLLQTTLDPSFTTKIVIPVNNVKYDIPNKLSDLNDNNISAFKTFIKQLEFIPDLIRDYTDVFDGIYEKYKVAFASLSSTRISPIDIDDPELIVTTNASPLLIELRNLESMHQSFMSLLKSLNEKLSKFNTIDMKPFNSKYIIEIVSTYSNTEEYKEWCQGLSGIINYQTLRNKFANLCSMKVEELVETSPTINETRENYVELFNRVISTIIDKSIKYVQSTTDIDYDLVENDGKIDGMLFKYNDRVITFVIENGDPAFNIIPSNENDITLIQITDTDGNVKPLSTFLYSQGNHMVQLQSNIVENPNGLQDITIYNTKYQMKKRLFIDEDKYYFITGGYENVGVEDITNDSSQYYYSNITEFIRHTSFVRIGSEYKMNFIKYLPEYFMNNIFTNIPDIFTISTDFYDSSTDKRTIEYTLSVDKSRNLSVLSNELKNQLTMSPDLPFKLTFGENKVYTLEYDGNNPSKKNDIQYYLKAYDEGNWRVDFQLDENFLVREIDIYFIKIGENDIIGSEDDVYLKISLRNDHYSVLCKESNVDVPSEILDIGINFYDVSQYFRNDNYFKAYRTDDKLIQKHWNHGSFLSGLLINQLPIGDNYISKEDIGMSISYIYSANDKTVIYTIENGEKHFHKFFGVMDVLNVFILDSEITKKNVFVRTLESEIFELPETLTMDYRQDIDIEIYQKITKMKIHFHLNDEKQVDEITITRGTYNTYTQTLVGIYNNEQSYVFNINNIENKKYGYGTIKFNLIIDEDKNRITFDYVMITLSDSNLTEFMIGDNTVYKIRHYHNYFNIESINISDEIQFEVADHILSLQPIPEFNYNKKLIFIKYYQNIIDSDLFTKDDDLIMTINKNINVINNQEISLRKSWDTTLETDNSITPRIPCISKFNAEQVDNKIIIPGIDNSIVSDDNAIKEDYMYINVSEANLLYLSLNVK